MSATAACQDRAKRNLLVRTHAMTGGGAERVAALRASGFAQAGRDVVLAVDFHSGDNLAWLDPAVRIVEPDEDRRARIAALARLLRSERPDILLAYDTLPPVVRRAVQESFYDLDCACLHRFLKQGATPEALAEHLRRSDVAEARKEALKVWGVARD